MKLTTQWDGVEEFLAVAESGNFTAAAGRLGVSVSLVSRRVSQLEQRLGAKLFKRTTRRVNLTASGEAYLLSCNQLVAGFNQAKEAIGGERAPARGLVRVGVIRGFASDIAAALLTRFLADNPEMSIELLTMVRDFDLDTEDLDIAVSNSSSSIADQRSELLTQRSFCMAASPAYLAAHGKLKTPGDLIDHECVLSNQPYWLLNFAGDVRPLQVKGRVRITNNIDGLLLAAIRGLGIIYISSYYIRPLIESQLLVPVLQDFWVKDVGVWLTHRYAQYVPSKIAAVVDYLHGNLDDPEAVTWRNALSRVAHV